MPPAAVAAVGAGLGLINTVEGAKAQGQQNQISQDQLQQIAQQRMLGRLIGRQGAVGNPFSASYGPMFDQMSK